MTIKKPTLLTQDEAFKLAGAVARLAEIKAGGSIITTSNSTNSAEAEVSALIDFLAQGLIAHASELLGCYFVVKSEYEPLCQALLPAFCRLNATIVAPKKEAASAPLA